MATEVAKIVIEGDTNGATVALKETARAADGVTTASKAAGAQLADLTKQTQATSKAQADATAAINRLKLAQDEAAMTSRAFGANSKEAGEAQDRLKRATQAAAAATATAKQELDQLKLGLAATSGAADKVSPALAKATAETVKLSAAAERNATELRKVELSQLANARASKKAATGFGNFATVAAGAVAAGAFASLTTMLKDGFSAAIATGASYETMRIALETTVGSAGKAATEFERLQQFAAATPYGVEEVTNAFIKLGNRGIEPTNRLLTSFGNTASAMGKTLDDYVEAVADAVTGENERLKEFGIVGKKHGDMIAYTFKGVTTEVKFSADAITEYLTQIGETEFAGGMERQSQSLAGMWSTQKDNAAALADEFTQGLAPALKDIMTGFGGVDEGGRAWAKALGEDLGGVLKTTVSILSELGETVSGENGTIAKFALLSVAIGGLYIPFKAASEFYAGWNDVLSDHSEWVVDTIPPTQKLGGVTLEIANAMGSAIQQTDAWRGASLLLTEALRLQAVEQEYANEQAKLAATLIGPEVPTKGFSIDSKGNHNPDKVKKGKKSKEAARIFSDSESGGRVQSYADDSDQIATAAAGQPAALAQAAADQEAAIRDERIAGLDREIEKLNALGFTEMRHVDTMMWSWDMKIRKERSFNATQVAGIRREQDARDALDARFRAEEKYARWAVNNAKNEAQREKGRTRLAEIEHRKRLMQISRAHAKEEKLQAKKVKLFATLNGHMQQLGGTLLTAMEAQVKGEKGAIAESVAMYAKGIRDRMILKALEETALGVAAAAGVFTAGFAAPHFIAAGVAAAAAAAAGGAQYGFHKLAVSQGFGKDKKESEKAGSGTSGGGGGGGGSSREGNERQDVPVSWTETRRGAADMPRTTQAANSTTNNITHVHVTGLVAGDENKLGAELNRLAEKGRRLGRRN
jgi:hypothetical protein